jgi:hypothetical protein
VEVKCCTKCKEEKSLEDYFKHTGMKDGRRPDCKACHKARGKKYQEQNKETIRQKQREYYQKNSTKIKARVKRHYEANPEHYKAYNKDYREANVEKIKAGRDKENHRAWQRKRRASDPVFKTAINISRRIRSVLGRMNLQKTSKTEEIIGCSRQELWKHLCDTFEANYGMPREWMDSMDLHIDHIIPISTATTEDEVYKLNHHTNLQILTAEDNLKKKDNLDWSLEC